MPLTKINTFANKTVIAGADFDAEFANIYGKFSAAIAAGDLSDSAGILLTQLAASKEHLQINLYVDSTAVGGGWPATGVLAAVPVPIISGVKWVATHCYWICNDTGGGAGTFKVSWGEYPDATGVWAQTAEVATATLGNPAAGADKGNNEAAAMTGGGTVDLDQSTGVRALALIGTGLDGTTISAAGGFVSVTVQLRRDISSS